MHDPFKTRKIITVPIPVPAEEAPSAPAQPAARPSSSSVQIPSSNPSSPSRITYGPPSSDSSWVTEGVTADRTTEPELAVPATPAKDRATLTVMTGINAGQVFALDGTSHVLGRGTEADIWIEDGAVSREHARISCRADGAYVVEDLGATNGTFVAGDRVASRELKSGDRVQLGPNVVLRFAITDDAEEELQRRLYESSTRDALTRVYNRKYFTERLVAEVAYSRRHRVKLSVLMMDIDEFKKLNDTHGHLAGDMVLRVVAAAVTRLIRVEDLLARWGGEEFVILARSTGRTDAQKLAERIREAVADLAIPVGDSDGVLKVSLSIGVAPLADAGAEAGPDELLSLADARMYRAKAAGRNRVVSED
ncbi:MAG: GGDEF domain-containing protein [Myxococcales bacterium]|jgi:diguanylate cyclase (GGDEF)-like protein|nr:GGDEF domain-containing protein [Myxococcales bacterium]